MACKVSLKVNFLDSYLKCFPTNLGPVIGGHREPFQQENNIHDEEAIAKQVEPLYCYLLLEFGKACRTDEMQAYIFGSCILGELLFR
jgi:hypothetical protein